MLMGTACAKVRNPHPVCVLPLGSVASKVWVLMNPAFGRLQSHELFPVQGQLVLALWRSC